MSSISFHRTDASVVLEQVTAFQDCAQLQYRTPAALHFSESGTYHVVFRPACDRPPPFQSNKDDKGEAHEEEVRSVTVNGGEHNGTSSIAFPASPHDRIWSDMDTDSLQVRLLHTVDMPSSLFSRLLLRDVGQRTRAVEDLVTTEAQQKKDALREVRGKMSALQREVKIREGSIAYLSQLKESIEVAIRTPSSPSLVDDTLNTKSLTPTPVEQFRLHPQKWAEMITFISSKTRSYRDEIMHLEEDIKKARKREKVLKEALEGLREDVDTHLFYRSRMETVVEATVELLPPRSSSPLDSVVSVGLQLSFMVPGVQWEPVYDVRVHRPTSTMEIGYFANVSQWTGVAWEEVVLRLSTARPKIGASPPFDENPWNISFNPPYLPMHHFKCCARRAPGIMAAALSMPNEVQGESENVLTAAADEMSFESVGMAAPDEVDSMAPRRKGKPMMAKAIARSSAIGGGGKQDMHAGNSGRATTFTIAGRVSILSDANHPTRVCIMVKTLPMKLKFTCTPKLDPLVYLYAHGVNTTPYEWLSGEACVYYNQAFVCRTTLPYTTGGGAGKIKIALGADEDSVKVRRKKVKQNSEAGQRKSLFSSTRLTVVHYSYNFEVTSEVPGAEIRIVDQYPMSTHEEMKVELEEPAAVSKKTSALSSSSSSKSASDDRQRAQRHEELEASGQESEFGSILKESEDGAIQNEDSESDGSNQAFSIRPGLTGTVKSSDHTLTWILKDPPPHETQRFPFSFSVRYPEEKFTPVGLDN